MQNKLKGFSLIEVILASAIFITFATAATVAVISAFNANRLGAEVTIANQFNAEGMEAIRSIKNQSFATLASKAGLGNQGLAVSGGVWTFSGTSNTFAADTRFTRSVAVTSAQRDGSGNIVASGGTVDSNTYKVVSTTSWNFNTSRPESAIFTSYLTNWRAAIASGKGGMLVYGDGGTTTDAVKYRILDGSAGTWGSATALPDFDVSATNKALRFVRVYASATRNEKIAISRYSNGSGQFIYGHVWNGSSWVSTQLGTWPASTSLDAKNFDGTYLANGNFMVVYSINTNIPQYRIWNGTSWGAETATVDVGGLQNYIIVRARGSTNEAMVAVFDNSSDVNTIYWSGSAWSATTEHAISAPLNTKEFIDFAWSPQDPLRGALVYTNSTTDKTTRMKIWTANGTGSGAWGTEALATAQTNNLGSLQVVGRKGANEFMACNKDGGAAPTIRCYKATFTSATPSVITWSNPTNQAIAAATDTGIQRSFDLEYEATSGDPAAIIYSDNTNVPKLKKYNAVTSTFDAAATNIATSPFTLGSPLRTVLTEAEESGNDIMILMADTSQDLYTAVWDGATNAVFTTPTGKAFSQQGTNGSVTTTFWYDFAWDKF